MPFTITVLVGVQKGHTFCLRTTCVDAPATNQTYP